MHDSAEEWKPVVGWEGLYEVSSHGRVRSVIDRKNSHAGRLLTPQLSNNLNRCYPQVCLADVTTGRKTTKTVHSLVAAAFIGPRPAGWQVNHKDGDKSNPRLSNLEYCTKSQNQQHAVDTGLRVMPFGEDLSLSHLSNDQVRRIRALLGTKMQKDIAAEFGIPRSTVSGIACRRIYSKVV